MSKYLKPGLGKVRPAGQLKPAATYMWPVDILKPI